MPFCHLFWLFPQLRDAPNTDVILSPIQILDSDTIQIHSRHGSHSVIYSRFKYSYNSDTLWTRMLFPCSYRSNLQIQLRYVPDTDTIPILILLTYNIQFNKQILDGIFKPISIKILPSLNGIFKPIPSATFWQVQIYGHTSVQSSFTLDRKSVV